MATWQDLENELDHWHQAGKTATLWWRDDDACALTPQLEKLIEIADIASIPVHLAVIPAKLEKDATKFLLASENTRILQHGFAHIDHAPKGEGSWELGDHRPLETVVGELKQGFDILHAAFGEKFLPVLVPPWTRFSDKLRPFLSDIGLKAYSAEGLRQRHMSMSGMPGLKTIHAHCDPISWKQNARFKGTERALDDFLGHLEKRRLSLCDPGEPSGLCTHHMDHSQELWQFLPEFLARTKSHPAVDWISIETELL